MKPIRGTKDYFGEEAKKFQQIVINAKRVGKLYGFEPLMTPIFESTDVFKRSIGDETDIVSKEMYSFETKGGDSITLRPEFTAGIVRSFISNGFQQNLPCKFFSYGPVFRYERPQKGRQRQFHQVNFEYFGNPKAIADAELILLAEQFLSSLGIDQNLKLNINTLGDKESRQKYRDALVEYLSSYKDDLSDDSKIRLQKNPLRILDSKDKRDREIISDAPKISDHLTDDAKKFFENVISYIEQKLSIELVINEKIVRGLDYYNHTVFEFISEDNELGSQNTILAGGRYDGLVKQMGGADTPAVGFAAGIERLMMLAKIDDKSTERRIAIISDFDDLAVKYADILRADKNIICEIIYSGNFSKKVKKADKMNATEILFCFEDKLELKNLETGEQKQLNIEDI